MINGKNRAISLVELLVIWSIIPILLALLLPARTETRSGEGQFMGNRFSISIFKRINFFNGQKFEVEINPDWVQEWIEQPELNYGIVVIMNHTAATAVTITSDDDFTDFDATSLLTVVTLAVAPMGN